MANFKKASRSAEDIKTAKQELDELFGVVRSKDGRLSPKAVKQLEANSIELGEALVRIINDEVALQDPLPLLVDVQDADLGEDLVWQEVDSSLRVVNRAPGSAPLSQRITFTEQGMTTTGKEVAVDIPLEKIATGRLSPSLAAEQMAEAIVRFRIGLVFDAIDAGVPSSADRSGVSGWNLRYSGLSLANLDAAVDGLLDEAARVTIIGRHAALYGIRAFTGWSDFAKQEFETRGQIGQYRGQPVVTLIDRTNQRLQTHVVSAKKVFLASATPGAILVEKDVSFLGYAEVDAKNAVFTTGIRIENGVYVKDPYQYRVITLP